MRTSLRVACLCVLASGAIAAWGSQDPPASVNAGDPVADALAGARASQSAGDSASAREAIERAVDLLLGERERGGAAAFEDRAQELARLAREVGAGAAGRRALEAVLASRAERLPADDPLVLRARLGVSTALHEAGDLDGAIAIQSEIVAALDGRVPDDDEVLRTALGNLTSSLLSLGEYARARELAERVLAACAGKLAPGDADLQAARRNVGWSALMLGDVAASQSAFEAELADWALRTDAPSARVEGARVGLAAVRRAAGDLAGARELEETSLAALERALPDDHQLVETVRTNLAQTLKQMGDLERARDLQERLVVAVDRRLPEGHPDRLGAWSNLGATLAELGDLERARTIQERTLAALGGRVPEEHPELARVRHNLAVVLFRQGDMAGAIALEERALAGASQSLPPGHPALLSIRGNLSAMRAASGDARASTELLASIAEDAERTGQVELALRTRLDLAAASTMGGDPDRGFEIAAGELVRLEAEFPPDHPLMRAARTTAAAAAKARGDLEAARIIEEALVAVLESTPNGEPAELAGATGNLARTVALVARKEAPEQRAAPAARFRALAARHATHVRQALSAALADASPREAEERTVALRFEIDRALSFARGLGVFPPDEALERDAFLLTIESRAAALTAARRARAARDAGDLGVRVRDLAAEHARLVQSGADSAVAESARARLEAAQRELARRAASHAPPANPTLDDLARVLPEESAAIAWMRHLREEDAAPAEHIAAFVLSRGATGIVLQRIDLGPAAAVEAAVARWRAAIGVDAQRGLAASESAADAERAASQDLAQRILAPLAAAVGGARRLIVAPDDVLCAVSLDALPAEGLGQGAAEDLVGDRFHVETRASLLELLTPTPRRADARGTLVALGNPAFDVDPDAAQRPGPAGETAATGAAPEAAGTRTNRWRRAFGALPETRAEVRAIAQYFEDAFGSDTAAHVLERRDASREALIARAPGAAWLHVATHGWYAPESVASFDDARGSGGPEWTSAEEHVRGTSPLLLAGLALSGANRPADALGRYPGIVTAAEIAVLDLSACEMSVVSACDTNVGVRRTGQGVASLQRALHMAGARSAVTSLWKVPDEATKDLMVDFYRRLWLEGRTKSEALWEAKRTLREARDDTGAPRYRTRDWAAWVLSGEPE